MRKVLLSGFWVLVASMILTGCNKPSKAEEYKTEKHTRDSVSLVQQERSMAYYQSQLDSLLPVADSLMAFFKYEKNEKYQDHGYYVIEKVISAGNRVRIMVRDDGKNITAYRNGVRMNGLGVDTDTGEMINRDASLAAGLGRAQHLQVVIYDINECERRIQRTSMEIQKYQRRLQR